MIVGAAKAAKGTRAAQARFPIPGKPSRLSPLQPIHLVLAAFGLISLGTLLHAAWIPAKAELAQWLIERSWVESLESGERRPPWPWADTRPAAVLEAPAHGIRLLVLEGNSGRNLAFGPVFADGTAGGQDMVISGHRDTHFRFLEALQTGDRLKVTRQDGTLEYEVVQAEIVDSREARMLIDPGMDRVSLATCYPFDSPDAGGPLRYVVTALAVSRRSVSSG